MNNKHVSSNKEINNNFIIASRAYFLQFPHVGAVLGKRIDKKLNVIQYASKTLDTAQRNYATTEKEFLAVVFACDKFRHYI